MTPQPTDPDSDPWWEGAARGELLYQRCSACGAAVFYPRALCPSCLAGDLAWAVASGRGEIYALTVVHRAPNRALADAVPYALALVDLEEGFRMLSGIVDCDPDSLGIGAAVEVVFRAGPDGRQMPYFRPAPASA